jgi:hypothetical protein
MNPLKHFLDSCLLYWGYIVLYFFSFVLMVGVTFVIVKGICDFIEFNLNRMLKKYFDRFDKK